MNRKFYFGLLLIVSGTTALSVVATLFLKDKIDSHKKPKTPSVTMTSKEVFAHLYAINSVLGKANDGGYDNVPDQQAAMENDFAFFKIDFMES